MHKLLSNYHIYLFVLLIGAGSGYGQNSTKHHVHFIRVVASQTTMRPPFERIETEISTGQICFRTVLPSKETINTNDLEKYNEVITTPVYVTPDPADYDSITNFILTSGLLNVDLNYTKPVPVNGVVAMKTGGGYGYTIETSEGLINLPVYDSRDFKLPEVLSNFDALFKRIIGRYRIKNEH
jgi:hypothetical protein